jgi:hypothetical protein
MELNQRKGSQTIDKFLLYNILDFIFYFFITYLGWIQYKYFIYLFIYLLGSLVEPWFEQLERPDFLLVWTIAKKTLSFSLNFCY